MSRSARSAAAVVLLAGIGTATLPTVPAAADQRPSFCGDSSGIPRTADSAEAWLRACADRRTQSADAADHQGSGNSAAGRLGSADSINRWLTSR